MRRVIKDPTFNIYAKGGNVENKSKATKKDDLIKLAADKDKLEFAICRITNKPSFKQVANNLFSTSLVLTESW